MSPEKSIQTPAIAYTAARLAAYAREHDIDTEQVFTPDISANTPDSLGSRALRYGYGILPTFEVADSVPRTIPIVLARLAIYDCRLTDSPSTWPQHLDTRFGIYSSSVRWLRLVQVTPSDKRVGEILSIVGASAKSNFEGVEQDQRGNPVPYTGHYYMESDKYAVKVAQYAPEQHRGLPVTGIEFILPDTGASTQGSSF